MTTVISIEEAKNNFKNNNLAKFPDSLNRLMPEVWPEVISRFKLKPGEKIYTIGSCFARNIELYLNECGFIIPTLDYEFPEDEKIGNRINSILNKYTPPNILQEIIWTKQIYDKGGKVTFEDCKDFSFKIKNQDLYLDLGLNIKNKAVSKQRFLERRQQIYNISRNIFSSDCVVITLGLIEAWFDKQKSTYIQLSPFIYRDLLREGDRFELHILNNAKCLEYIKKSIELIKSMNPDVKILLTTSPVSLGRTFTNQDIIIENLYSKCILRAVCGEIYNTHDFVDYFPSFESVILTKSWKPYAGDFIHITDEFVEKIVQKVKDNFLENKDESDSYFDLSKEYYEKNNIDQAINLILKAINLSNKSHHLHFLSVLLFKTGKFDESTKYLESIIQSNPAFSKAYYLLSKIDLKNGNYNKALELAQKATKIKPANKIYDKNLYEIQKLIKNKNKYLIKKSIKDAAKNIEKLLTRKFTPYDELF